MPKRTRKFAFFLEDILDAIEKIEKYIKGFTFEEFCTNDIVIDAIMRNLEVVGEASKNVPKNIKRKYTFVEWKEAIGFRNVLIHDYFGIDLESVWDTIKNNLPSLKENIKKVLEAEKTGL